MPVSEQSGRENALGPPVSEAAPQLVEANSHVLFSGS